MSVNLVLFGLTGPFAAAAMLRFGVRRVFLLALSCCAAGSALTVGMTAAWQLVLFTGVLTAASATGQLVFLPLLAALVTASGWRSASLAVSIAALLADVAARRPFRRRPRWPDAGCQPTPTADPCQPPCDRGRIRYGYPSPSRHGSPRSARRYACGERR